MKFSEKWLREWVNPQLTAQQLADQLTMSGLEVGSCQAAADDTIIEIDFTPNRGDCISVQGLAREIAAINNIAFKRQEIATLPAQHDQFIELEIEAKEECPRYVTRVITNLKQNVNTPDWVQQRLEASDIRCIHPVVDILNYVMLELGQPMHAFDFDQVQKSLKVRLAKEHEKITLLDDKEVVLKAGTLVIADEKGSLAIAGIMGSKESGVSATTKNILLESALFTPILMAGKARLYGLNTDSSYRFERGVDPQLQKLAIERASALITEICGGELGPVVEQVQKEYLPKPVKITLRRARLIKILGIEIASTMVSSILKRLDCEFSYSSDAQEIKAAWQVTPPSFRYDLTSEIDLIEEIARLIGYDNIPNNIPATRAQFMPIPKKVPTVRIKRALVDLGYQEIISYSFVDDNLQKVVLPEQAAIPLVNPISADMNVMRLSIWPGLLNVLKFNQNRQLSRLKLFEVGLCFIEANGAEIKQSNKLGGLLCGDYATEQWGITKRAGDFYDMKHTIETLWQIFGHKESLEFMPVAHPTLHPGQTAQILWQGKKIGVMGRLHPQIQKTLDLDGPIFLFELKLDSYAEIAVPVFQRPSRFPEIRRDIAVVVDENITGDALIHFVRKSAGEMVREVKIFDVYTGKGIDSGRKSIAMGLILQHSSRTLVDQEVDEVIHTVVTGLEKEFRAVLRD